MAKKAKRKAPAKKQEAKKYWLTTAYLREQRACSGEVARFEKAFGSGAEVNLENATKAARLGMDMTWVWSNDPNYAPEDFYYDELRKQRNAYTGGVAAVPQARAFMATFKKYPVHGLLGKAAATKRANALKKVKELIKKGGFTIYDLPGLDEEKRYTD